MQHGIVDCSSSSSSGQVSILKLWLRFLPANQNFLIYGPSQLAHPNNNYLFLRRRRSRRFFIFLSLSFQNAKKDENERARPKL